MELLLHMHNKKDTFKNRTKGGVSQTQMVFTFRILVDFRATVLNSSCERFG